MSNLRIFAESSQHLTIKDIAFLNLTGMERVTNLKEAVDLLRIDNPITTQLQAEAFISEFGADELPKDMQISYDAVRLLAPLWIDHTKFRPQDYLRNYKNFQVLVDDYIGWHELYKTVPSMNVMNLLGNALITVAFLTQYLGTYINLEPKKQTSGSDSESSEADTVASDNSDS